MSHQSPARIFGFFWDRVPGCPRIYNPPTSASWALALQVFTSTPQWYIILSWIFLLIDSFWSINTAVSYKGVTTLMYRCLYIVSFLENDPLREWRSVYIYIWLMWLL
jgi:hypothetical protein